MLRCPSTHTLYEGADLPQTGLSSRTMLKSWASPTLANYSMLVFTTKEAFSYHSAYVLSN